jgi:hypothetical protein
MHRARWTTSTCVCLSTETCCNSSVAAGPCCSCCRLCRHSPPRHAFHIVAISAGEAHTCVYFTTDTVPNLQLTQRQCILSSPSAQARHTCVPNLLLTRLPPPEALYISPHTTIYVSSYCYTTGIYIYAHTSTSAGEAHSVAASRSSTHVSSYYYIYVSSY